MRLVLDNNFKSTEAEVMSDVVAFLTYSRIFALLTIAVKSPAAVHIYSAASLGEVFSIGKVFFCIIRRFSAAAN